MVSTRWGCGHGFNDTHELIMEWSGSNDVVGCALERGREGTELTILFETSFEKAKKRKETNW